MTGISRVVGWVQAHAQEARLTAIIVASVAAVAAGYTFYERHQRAQAEQAFAQALATYHAPLTSERAEGAPAPSGPEFASADEKFSKAQSEFEQVASRFGSTTAGRRALYYAALCRLQRGQYAEAETALTAVAAGSSGHPLEAALARLSLAEAYRSRGETEKAVAAYRQLLDDASLPLPKDHVLMRLSSLLEEARRLPEATASYERLSEEYPESVYADEARRKTQYLAQHG